MKVIIDAGHGGKDSGAVGPTGLRECDVNLQIAKELDTFLKAAGHDTVMLRKIDATMSLEERTKAANKAGGDCYVAIHCNAFFAADAHGFEVWTTPGQTRADKLASAIFAKMADGLKGYRGSFGRQDVSDGDADKESQFWVLKHSNMPAVLSESAFISNPEQEADMRTNEWVKAVAKAHFDGIIEWGKK